MSNQLSFMYNWRGVAGGLARPVYRRRWLKYGRAEVGMLCMRVRCVGQRYGNAGK